MPSRVEQFQKLAAQQPDNELFRFSLAQALLADDRPADALPHLEYCVAKKSDWMMAEILLGKTQLRLGARAEARIRFQHALDLAVSQQHEDPERELRALLADL